MVLVDRTAREKYSCSNASGWGVCNMRSHYCYYAANTSDPRHLWQVRSVCPCNACLSGDPELLLVGCEYEGRTVEGEEPHELSSRAILGNVTDWEVQVLADKRRAFMGGRVGNEGSVVVVKHLYSKRMKNPEVPEGALEHTFNGQKRYFTLYQVRKQYTRSASTPTVEAVPMCCTVRTAGALGGGDAAAAAAGGGGGSNGLLPTQWSPDEGATPRRVPLDLLCMVDVNDECGWEGTQCTLSSRGLLKIVAHGNFAVYQA